MCSKKINLRKQAKAILKESIIRNELYNEGADVLISVKLVDLEKIFEKIKKLEVSSSAQLASFDFFCARMAVYLRGHKYVDSTSPLTNITSSNVDQANFNITSEGIDFAEAPWWKENKLLIGIISGLITIISTIIIKYC